MFLFFLIFFFFLRKTRSIVYRVTNNYIITNPGNEARIMPSASKPGICSLGMHVQDYVLIIPDAIANFLVSLPP